ncbi:pilus assembly protein N-terminal domain-containing protein [Paenalcaligenes niemegkensis]|nr:pilus assembly protein N-terminal domain-containing protein [Paenalcaligenes niemegkensis]MCQ9616991.1 pilus assembly protein N-terminal domain-containing protein [Paenalcaligenes niemegkensis]
MKLHKLQWLWLVAALVMVAAMSPLAVQANTVELVVHDQELLRFTRPLTRVAVGDDAVADVQVLESQSRGANELLLIAKRAGNTDLRVWLQGQEQAVRYQVRVKSQVDKALSDSGRQVQADVGSAGSVATITGTSDSLLEHRDAIASASGANNDTTVVDLSEINLSGMVQVDVKVVEVSRSVMKDVGISAAAQRSSGRWAADIALPLTATNGFNLMFSSASFNARLSLLEQNRMARVLAEPTLVALSGQSASFLAGGEVPVPEAGGLGTTSVTYKPFGVGLTVTPTVLSRDRISLKVAPESSELDYGNAIPVASGDNVTLMPAFRTRRAETTVELGDGESYIISGLVSRQTAADVAKMPFLGDLPIIGAFFRSVRYSQQELELIIVVTPDW